MENSLTLYSYGNMVQNREKISADMPNEEIKLDKKNSSSRTLLYVCATM